MATVQPTHTDIQERDVEIGESTLSKIGFYFKPLNTCNIVWYQNVNVAY